MIFTRRRYLGILLFIGFAAAGLWSSMRLSNKAGMAISVTANLQEKVIKILADEEHSCILCITESRIFILDSSTMNVLASESIDYPLDGYVVSNSNFRYVIVSRNGCICRYTFGLKSSVRSKLGFGDLVGSACSKDGAKLAVIPTGHPSGLYVVDLVDISVPIIDIDTDIYSCLFGKDTTSLLTSSPTTGLVLYDLKTSKGISLEIQVPNADVTMTWIQNEGWLIISDRHLYQIHPSSVQHLFLGRDQLILSQSSASEILLFIDKGDTAHIQRVTSLSLEDICIVPNVAPSTFCISQKNRNVYLGYSDGTIHVFPF